MPFTWNHLQKCFLQLKHYTNGTAGLLIILSTSELTLSENVPWGASIP